MSRHIDRTHVFKLVFQLEFSKPEELLAELDLYIDENLTQKDDKDFIKKEFLGVTDKLEETDKVMGDCVTGWSLERMDKTDLAILRLAAYEIIFTDLPDGIAVNEAVLLAKEFSGEKSPGFINAVLSRIIKEKA